MRGCFIFMATLSSKVSKFKCVKSDEYLHRMIQIIHFALVNCNKIDEKNLDIMESETLLGVYYLVRNKKLNLNGFIGRDRKSGEALFIFQDNGRLECARKEGWENSNIWSKVGVLKRLNGVNDLAKFLSGMKGYETIGEYITGEIESEQNLLEDSSPV